MQFAQTLAEALVEHDPSQSKNLRLLALESMAVGLAERVSECERDDSLTNAQPESYRAFGLPRSEPGLAGRWEHGGKMRFMPRWVATVPGIDLRSVLGDWCIVSIGTRAATSSARAAVDLAMTSPGAAAVATPFGPARLHPTARPFYTPRMASRFPAVVLLARGGGACARFQCRVAQLGRRRGDGASPTSTRSATSMRFTARRR